MGAARPRLVFGARRARKNGSGLVSRSSGALHTASPRRVGEVASAATGRCHIPSVGLPRLKSILVGPPGSPDDYWLE